MEWAQKRKIIYAVSFSAVVILLAAYPTYQLVHRTPTCFDKSQNGDETGVDCGGGCALVCVSDVKALRVNWAKAFSLGDNRYDFGAYVENPNTNAGVKNVHYTIRAFDNADQLLAEKTGTTEIAPASALLLFETGVTLSSAPTRVEAIFAGEDLTRWTKASLPDSVVLTKNQNLINTDTKPRFDAVLVNTDPVNDVTNLVVAAVIYDVSRNPIAVSRTYVDSISKNGEKNIFFTWPKQFTSTHENFITEIVVTPRAIFAN